jgi:pimeloyl-ACP methyl ester carboxylesterase
MWRASTTAVLSWSLVVQTANLDAFAATLEPHVSVRGAEVAAIRLSGAGVAPREIPWDDLDRTSFDPGLYRVRFPVDASEGDSLELPHCAGRQRVTVDGREVAAPAGPLVVPLSEGRHEIGVAVAVGPYERRIACGDRPRWGAAVRTLEGLGVLTFASPWSARGGGRAVVYVPPRHDIHVASPLLVGLHPWNGSMWTYAAYAQLLREARAHDTLLLMPSGLGNSLYTADAEDEVMRAIAAAAEVLAVDQRAVSLWGASMGGAGATTIGFHHPDRFASVVSFFGDSKYDLGTYARSILPTEAAAHLVNALDVVENARNLPVWLIHGEDDRTSPIRQSEILERRMKELGFAVRFDRVPAVGHSGALVARFLPEVVASAASARASDHVTRVTYRSVRASDSEAYGVRWERAKSGGDAYLDIERREGAVHVLRAESVRTVTLLRGALDTSTALPPPIVVDGTPGNLSARWEP